MRAVDSQCILPIGSPSEYSLTDDTSVDRAFNLCLLELSPTMCI